MPRRALALRHVAFEDLDALEAPLRAAGFEIDRIDVPGRSDFGEQALAADLLIVLGGPIGVHERSDHPFLDIEIEAVRARLRDRRPTLGICLGAQVMAAALGARVHPGDQGREIGWKPITLTDAGRNSALAPLGSQPVLHWHGDTFSLPEGARLLASTEQYPNQAFAVGRHALALQFHIEASASGLEHWYVGHTCELGQAGIAIGALRRAAAEFAPATSQLAETVLARFLADAFGPG